MAPTTQPQNKGKHHGLLDLPQPSTWSPARTKGKSKLEHNTIVNEVTALEMELCTTQKEIRSTARQPPRPNKLPHSQSVQRLKSSGQKGTL